MKKRILCAFFLGVLGACSSGQTLFYWERANTGAAWFVRDHNQCLSEADWWPYEWPGMPWGWGKPADLDLRFQKESDSGIWAQFVPYPGAMPVYVNSVAGDWSMSVSSYESCMEKRQYLQKKVARIDRQVQYE